MLDNRVEQRTVAQGLAPYTLDQVVSGRRSFATVFAHNDLVRYTVESTDGALFEINEGELDTGFVPPRLSRARLIASTTGSAIDWPDSAPKRIFCDADAELFGPLGGQLILAALDGASTVDAIVAKTAIKTPVLKDGMCVEVDLAGANTVTNPTFKLNALAPKTIVLPSGGALPVGYLRALRTRLSYDSGADQWLVLRPHEVASQAAADAGADDNDFITAKKLWATPMRGGWRNIVGANGGFEIGQRGAGGGAIISVAAATIAYTLDRWYLATNANQAHVVSQQPGLVPASATSCRIRRQPGETGVGDINFGFPLDLDEIHRRRGSKLSLRCLLRAGADWSPTSGNIRVIVAFGTGAVQKRVVGYTGQVNVLDQTFPVTPGGPVQTATIPLSASAVPTNATQGEVFFFWTPVGAAGTNDYIEIDDLDVRADEPVVSYFERRPYEDELQSCLRHFWKTFPHATAPAQNSGVQAGSIAYRVRAAGAVTQSERVQFPVPMRIAPTMTFYNPNNSNANWRNSTDGADSGAATADFVSELGLQVRASQVAGDGVGDQLIIHATADAGI